MLEANGSDDVSGLLALVFIIGGVMKANEPDKANEPHRPNEPDKANKPNNLDKPIA